MNKVVFLHPSIRNLSDMEKYLCLCNINIEELVTWDEKEPDIVIASEHIYNDYKTMKQLKRYYDQKAILVYHAGEASFPDLTIFDYSIAINTRLKNLDRITRIPPVLFYARSTIEGINTNTCFEIGLDNILQSKTGFCNFIYANPIAHPMRDSLFWEISKYKKVDSLGNHLNNVGNKTSRRKKNWAALSVEMKQPYKFSIASENALFDGYTSEKLLTSFQAHSIPIYWGNPYVAEEFNSEAFINCHNYKSVEEVVERVKEINENDDLWKRIISAPWQTQEQIKKTQMQMKEYESFMIELFSSEPEKLKRRPEGTFARAYAKWFFKPYKVQNTFIASARNYIKRKIKSL